MFLLPVFLFCETGGGRALLPSKDNKGEDEVTS